jgi:hypothetical protein
MEVCGGGIQIQLLCLWTLSIVLFLCKTTFRILDSVSVFKWNLMFGLTLADGLCFAWFTYPILCWRWCPEIGTSAIDWVQLSRFHLKTETESKLHVLTNLRTFWAADIFEICYRCEVKGKAIPEQAMGAHRVVKRRGSTFSSQSADRRRCSCHPYTLAGRSLHSERFLVLISVVRWVDPRATMWLSRLDQLKNPVISSRKISERCFVNWLVFGDRVGRN